MLRSKWEYRTAIQLAIPLVPEGKARHRMRVFGKFASAYSCPKQKKHIAAMQQHMSAEGGEPLEGPLHLDLIAYMPTQKSWPKKKIQAALSGSLLHTNKPDASNILKLVEDAANGILFKDDSQIVSAIVTKEYSEMPHYFLTICEMIPVGVE